MEKLSIDVDFSSMSLDEAIYTIDGYIDDLYRIREEILEGEDND